MNWLAKKFRGVFASRPAPPDVPSPVRQPGPAPSSPPPAPEEIETQHLLQQGKMAEALKLARVYASQNSKRPGANFLLATCLDRIGRYEEAAEVYRAELAINPAHEGARARGAQVEASLVAPVAGAASPEQRNWRTSLPRPLLMSIQQAHLHYHYRGVSLIKNPFDLALYSQLLWEVKPRTIVEIGSKHGGSALWMGDLLNNYGVDGHIYSLDLVKVEAVSHPRVTYLEGDGRALGGILSPAMLEKLPRPWLVIEDADHEYETSIHVLDFFHPWLHRGEYIVVEDGILSDFLEDPECNSGPHRALKEFLKRLPGQYEIDARYCDYFGHNVTWCTNGFLRKTAG